MDLPLHFLGAWDLGLEEGGGGTFLQHSCFEISSRTSPDPHWGLQMLPRATLISPEPEEPVGARVVESGVELIDV